jgi:hypothetical protein
LVASVLKASSGESTELFDVSLVTHAYSLIRYLLWNTLHPIILPHNTY